MVRGSDDLPVENNDDDDVVDLDNNDDDDLPLDNDHDDDLPLEPSDHGWWRGAVSHSGTELSLSSPPLWKRVTLFDRTMPTVLKNGRVTQ